MFVSISSTEEIPGISPAMSAMPFAVPECPGKGGCMYAPRANLVLNT